MPEGSSPENNGITNPIELALQLGNSLQAWGELHRALAEEATVENYSPWLGRVATALKQAGCLERAVEVLEKKYELQGDAGDRIVLGLWKKELSRASWQMARKDTERSSHSYCTAGNNLRFSLAWDQPFSTGPLRDDTVWNLPAPIVAYDMLITFSPTLQGFVGLEMGNGQLRWESGVISGRLEYAMTPVYLSPYLYFFAPGIVRRKSLLSTERPLEVVTTSQDLQLSPYAAPLAWGQTWVAATPTGVYLHHFDSGQSHCCTFPLEDQERLQMPVVCRGNLYLLSNRGRLFRLIKGSENPELIKEFDDREAVYAPPCVVKDNIYFECVSSQGMRRLCCYNPEDQLAYMRQLEDEHCNVNHTHLNFPAIARDNAVLFCSDNNVWLYQVQQLGEVLEVIPIRMHTQAPQGLVQPLPQFYSSMVNNFFIAKYPGGFSCINTLNGSAQTQTFLPQRWEIITQPLVYGSRLLFICKEGIKCYEIL